MSVVALSDLLFGDLLTETNMKPWWEKVRGYLFATSMAFALSATYLTLNGVPMDCLPAETSDMSFAYNLSALQGAWTNTYCSINIPWYFSYLGPICLAAATFLLLASSYWLYIPAVIDSFVTFFEMETIISDTNMTLEEMQKTYCQTLESQSENDKQTKLRKVCVEIWEGERDLKLANVYLIRNCIFIVSSIIVGLLFSFIAHVMRLHGHRFRCNITSEDAELLNDNQRFPVSFVCVSSLTGRLITFDIIFATSVIAQVLPIGLGMLKWKCRKTELHGFDNASFMIYFWKCGKPSRSKTFLRLIKHVCRKAAVDDIKNEIRKAILFKDHDLVRNFIKLTHIYYPPTHDQDTSQSINNKMETEPPVDFIITKISEVYQSQFEGILPKDPEEIRNIETAIVATIRKHLTSETTVDKCKPILKKASADRRWKLFVEIFNECICKFGNANSKSASVGYRLLTDLHVECDILDGDGCSIMHYFLDMPRLKSISSLITKQYENMGLKLYVHSRGKSSLVEKTENTDGLLDGKNKHSLPSGQMKMKEYYKDFLDISNSWDPSDTSAIDKFNRRLSLIKFHKWDDDAKHFAHVARSKQMLWSTFVTLLNCYIIPENAKEQIVPLPCEGNVSYMFWNQTLPYLLQPGPFVTTAHKYIFSCFTTDERIKVRNVIEGWKYVGPANRGELLRFIDRCNKSPYDRSYNKATPNDVHGADENTPELAVATTDNATGSRSSSQVAASSESCTIEIGEKEPLVQGSPSQNGSRDTFQI